MSLEEGILVCDDRARVVFYNPAARRVFHDNPALAIGRSLNLLIAATPVENSLQLLRQQRARNLAPGDGGEDDPLPTASNRWGPPPPRLPERPVYVEVAAPRELEEAGDRERLPLDRLTFVVFDTETTGLAPGEGYRIVSLVAVKIVNRGIIVGEIFDRLVDPWRSIPQSSVRFHGITDEMVRGKPRLGETLRAFHAFAGDAVLVGHNAAFDMRFIRLGEQDAGVRFHGLLLDTLALSRFLHDHTPYHSLDAVARRLGVTVRDRHTALGDSLITAQVLLKLLYLLQKKRGGTTLGRALEVSRQ